MSDLENPLDIAFQEGRGCSSLIEDWYNHLRQKLTVNITGMGSTHQHYGDTHQQKDQDSRNREAVGTRTYITGAKNKETYE